MVESDHPSLSISRQCELLGISRAAFYYRPAEVSDEDLACMRATDEIYTRRPYFGVRRLREAKAAFDPDSSEDKDLPSEINQVKGAGDTKISAGGDALRYTQENRFDKEFYEAEGLPGFGHWRKQGGDYSEHCGIGITVEEDGKEEILVIQSHGRPRDYVTHNDFAGKRYTEIPNGEASWALTDWGIHFKSEILGRPLESVALDWRKSPSAVC